MFNQEDYINKQQELYKQYIRAQENADKAAIEAIAHEMFIAYLNKEMSQEEELDNTQLLPPDSPKHLQGLKFKITPMAEHFQNDPRPGRNAITIAFDPVTPENIQNRMSSCVSGTTGKATPFPLELMTPIQIEGLCNAINSIIAMRIEEAAKATGYDVTKTEQGFSLIEQKSASNEWNDQALHDRVEFVQDEVKSMKQQKQIPSQLSTPADSTQPQMSQQAIKKSLQQHRTGSNPTTTQTDEEKVNHKPRVF